MRRGKGPAVGRGDLIRLREGGLLDAGFVAELMGYQQVEEEKERGEDLGSERSADGAGIVGDSGPTKAKSGKEPEEEASARRRFLLPVLSQLHETGGEPRREEEPERQRGVAPLTEVEYAIRPEAGLPERNPLMRWARLVHFMRGALGAELDGRQVDEPRLARRIARGEPLTEIPARPCRKWGLEGLLLLDRGQEMRVFQEDRKEVVQELIRDRGREGLRMEAFDFVPTMEEVESWSGLAAPVLVISAMGQLVAGEAGAAVTERWKAIGRRLRERGHRISALVPCPRSRWDEELARVWACAEWDRNARVPRSGRGLRALDGGDEGPELEDLLTLLSPSTLVRSGLLRDVRLLLENEGHVGLEYDAWTHETDTQAGTEWFSFRRGQGERVERLRDLMWGEEIGPDLDPDKARMRQDACESIAMYHQRCSPVIEAEALKRIAWALGEPLDRGTEDLLCRASKSMASVAESDEDLAEGRRTGLPGWFIGQMERLPVGLRGDEDLSVGLARAYYWSGVEEVEWLDGVDVEVANAEWRRLEQGEHEWGRSMETLWLEGEKRLALEQPSAQRERSWSAASLEMRGRGLEIWQQTMGGKEYWKVKDVSALAWDVRDCQALTVDSDVHGLHFQAIERPAWAKRMKRDRYGLRAELDVEGVRVGLRWIPPGRFLMGDEEYGPVHEVQISMGYWMMESTVTRALWSAVRGEKEDPEKSLLPKNEVSWDDAVAFCESVGERVPGLSFSLPTEAQWEYACRAGTTGDFNVDGVDPEVLAWSDGAYPGEPNPVRQKQSNAWGLYDMHGNVWEWCLDPQRDYSGAVADPVGSLQNGADRVLRGGSWDSSAQDCRSAQRNAYDPGDRLDLIGFRLLAGQYQQVSRGAVQLRGRGSGASGLGAEPGIRKPKWASEMLHDEYGVRAELEVKGVRFGFRWIRPGKFLMGSPEDEEGRLDNEGPQHEVTLTKGYWMAETSVTQEQWKVVMGENPSRFEGKILPVGQVSWEDCQEYAKRLNEMAGGLDLKLPTEAEWEYACRAGTTGALNVEGAKIGDLGWYADNSERQSREVGQKESNRWGLYDMLGNVWEWCQDGRRDYRSEAVADPAGPLQEGAYHVLRGGSWLNSAQNCRSARRDASRPGGRVDLIGFRLLAGQPDQEPVEAEPPPAGGAEREPVSESSLLPVSLWSQDARVEWPWDEDHQKARKPGPEKPSWAHDVGEDEFGIWAEARVQEVKFVFRQIEPGTFQMGSPDDEEGRYADEGPPHEVTLTAGFWMADAPVTQEQWQVVTGENPSEFSGENRPVETVSWDMCQQYLTQLNQEIPDLGAALPLEAQWEYACRAGTTGALNVEGASLDELAWYDRSQSEGSHEVREKAPNKWGLHDMLGNVWEWCQDGPREYRSEAVADPAGPLQEGAYRVLRGGSWFNSALHCRSAQRRAYHPGYRDADIGFRLLAGQPDRKGTGARSAGKQEARSAQPETRSRES
ncbi:MAG: formylglycine-generating enzyme family protein [Verrucomicrobiota bacterium]